MAAGSVLQSATKLCAHMETYKSEIGKLDIDDILWVLQPEKKAVVMVEVL